jgi:GDP-mannose 6-dehydrogenase
MNLNVSKLPSSELVDTKLPGAESLTISVFGAGYVGCVSAACLVNDGFKVVAVDPDQAKVAALSEGRAPIYEPGLGELIAEGHANGALVATVDYVAAVHNSDVSFCCPGTPSREDGSLDTRYVRTVSEQIGEALRSKDAFHVVVMRSTILPGTVESIVIPALEQFSGKKAASTSALPTTQNSCAKGPRLPTTTSPARSCLGNSRATPGPSRRSRRFASTSGSSLTSSRSAAPRS